MLTAAGFVVGYSDFLDFCNVIKMSDLIYALFKYMQISQHVCKFYLIDLRVIFTHLKIADFYVQYW